MNEKDIDVALMFLFSTDEPNRIAMMCNKAQDMGLVKRAIFQRLGAPSKQITHEIYYGNKVICVFPSHVIIDGFGDHIYYIPYHDNTDWQQLCVDAGVRQRQVPYDMSLCPWLNESDIYRLLIADGNSADVALHKMYCDGLITKGADNE